jgi:hypothetical protein
MQSRVLRRAATLASIALLLTTIAAHAETVTADGDLLTPGVQGTRYLGTASPGQDLRFDVDFILTCSGTSHINAGQSIRLSPGVITVPAGGSFGVSSLTFAPPAGWPVDGAECPTDLAPVTSPPLHMIVTAPTDPGVGYRYSFTWNRSLVPSSTGDAGVIEAAATTLVFTLDVVDNTPPTLNLPADSTVEGSVTGGAPAAYTVSATDAEDAVAPTPTCSPSVGSLLPLGTTTVTCSVTDGGGLTTTGSFAITVVDTTAPVMPNVADFEVTTLDPTGTTLSYGFFPSFYELVDPSPTIDCLPADGSWIPVGTTTVTCTATDHSGNSSQMSFHVTVNYVPPVSWTAVWGEPVPTFRDVFVANPGRAVPIKVEIFADGVEQTSGHALLTVTPCEGTGEFGLALDRDTDRWTGKLDTSLLAGPGCYTATVSLDGNVAGSFRMDLRGTAPASTPTSPKARANR